MRIGEVHAQLRKDFPDVELSKIRYYEDKGLVQPSRSRKGYRLYSERDLECLREAIRLANEEFVPLRVVRLRLIEQGLLSVANVTPMTRRAARESSANVVSALAPSVDHDGVSGDTAAKAPKRRPPAAAVDLGHVSVHDLLATSELTAEEFNLVQSMGLVTPEVINGETMYAQSEVRTASLARALLARGIDARALGSIRRNAEREIGVLDELTAPLRQFSGDRSPEEIRSIVSDVAREVNALRTVLLERELARYLAP